MADNLKMLELIEKLSDLKSKGVISEEEFEREKARLFEKVAVEEEPEIKQPEAHTISDITPQFIRAFEQGKKSYIAAFLLCLFLGNFGAQAFYLGKIVRGIVSLIFCWTGIPGLLAFIELFFIDREVNTYNQNHAELVLDGLNIIADDERKRVLNSTVVKERHIVFKVIAGVLIALFIFGIVSAFIMQDRVNTVIYSQTSNYVNSGIQGINKKVIDDSIDQYNIAKKSGNAIDICVHAGMVKAACLQAKDEDGYKLWAEREKEDCKKVSNSI